MADVQTLDHLPESPNPAPTRTDSASFDSRGDGVMSWLVALVPAINTLIAGLNAVIGHLNTVVANLLPIQQAADNAAVASAKASEAATIRDDAVAQTQSRMEKADAFANAPLNAEVEVGKYSARHYATQAAASASAASAVSGLPAFGAGDAGKAVVVNDTCTGFSIEVVSRCKNLFVTQG